MRILYLAHRIPFPPNKGDKIRAYQEIRALAERGHEVHLRAFVDDPADLEHVNALKATCATVEVVLLDLRAARLRALCALPGRHSLSVAYFRTQSMHRLVTEVANARPIDAAVAYSSTMAQYVPESLFDRTVVDLVDVDSAKWADYSTRSRFPRSAIYRSEAGRLRTYKQEIMRTFPHVVLTTPHELSLLWPTDRARMHAIGAGVDLEHFSPMSSPRRRGNIVFTGAMDYFANVDGVRWFAKEVLPRLIDIPDICFTIVGSRPTASVVRLQAKGRIEVTGTVPDVRPYLHAASIVVVPLRIARGVQNKVLEAMACGRPLVVTPKVAKCMSWSVMQQSALIAEDPGAFASAVRRVLTDPDLASTLGRQGRELVEREYQWAPMLDTFCGIIESFDSNVNRVSTASLAS